MSAKRAGKFKHTESDRSYNVNVDDDYMIWWLILQMRRSLHKAWAKELFQHNLTPEKVAAMFIITVIGYRATPSQISRYLLREPHSVSSLLKRMQEEGLVVRAKDLERKNLVRFALTEKGKKAYSLTTKRESIRNIMSCLSKEELQQMKEYLERLRTKAIEELGIVEPLLPGYDVDSTK